MSSQASLFKRVQTSHEDLIHDISYNSFGTRMATCSLDQSIRVYDVDDAGDFVLSADWKAHNGSVFKITWAEAEFGEVLATASSDCSVVVWEREGNAKGSDGLYTWKSRARLVDSRQAVTDIAFAPKHLGLQLATCSDDGTVRVYEASDIMNLSHWSLVDEFDAMVAGGGLSISWNPSPFRRRALAVAGSEKSFQVYVYNEDQRTWIPTIEQGNVGHHHDAAIRDISWAPNLGRSYDLLATASKDRTVKIWKLHLPKDNSTKAGLEQIACLREHDSEVWHVEWNITGTVLATSGDDGVVRLWRREGQQYECINVVSPSQ